MKPLEFSYKDRSYYLKFNLFNIIFIYDGVCKSLMCQDLKELSKQDEAYADVCVLNVYDSDKVESLLKAEETYEKYKYFVIDNADLLVTPEISNIIRKHWKWFWVLIGRNIPNCVLTRASICKLSEVVPNHFETDYKIF